MWREWGTSSDPGLDFTCSLGPCCWPLFWPRTKHLLVLRWVSGSGWVRNLLDDWRCYRNIVLEDEAGCRGRSHDVPLVTRKNVFAGSNNRRMFSACSDSFRNKIANFPCRLFFTSWAESSSCARADRVLNVDWTGLWLAGEGGEWKRSLPAVLIDEI